jgi:single-strand DNA-binding protein
MQQYNIHLQQTSISINCFQKPCLLLFRNLKNKIMNTLRNSVRLYGNVGQDPEVKSLENGTKLAKFSLATLDKHKDAKGEWVDETTWHNLVVFGKQVDIVEKYVNKGDKLFVEGKLTNRSYEGKDGAKKYFTEVVINEILLGNNQVKPKSTQGKDPEENLPF